MKMFDYFDTCYGFNFFAAKAEDSLPPRTDWVFMCPYGQLLGWQRPEEARNLWKAKCGDLEESIITDEDDLDIRPRYVRHFRDERQIKKDVIMKHLDPRGLICILNRGLERIQFGCVSEGNMEICK
jgi:hypothetical protein